MNPFVLQLLISLPFLIVAAIIGIIYFISGYKKGLWRALISLGITLISIPLAVLLANLIAAPMASAIVGGLPEDILEPLGYFSGMLLPLLTDIVKVVLAAVLFLIILLILLIVLKLIGNRIKWSKLNVDNTGLKLAGMGVRAIDTILVALMLLLPVYGTVSLVSPIAALAVDVAGIDDENVVNTVDAVDNNLCVSFYKGGPGHWVLKGLSGTSANGSFNIADISAHVRSIYKIYDTYANAKDMEEKCEAALLLSNYLEENLLEEEWFYDLLDTSVSELESQLRKADDKDAKEIKQYVDLFDMNTKELKNVLGKSVNLIQTAVEDEDIIDFLSSKEKDYDDLSDDFYEDLGELLNETKEIKDAKKLLYKEKARVMFVGYANEYDWILIEDVYSAKERTELTKQYASEFVEDYYDKKLSPDEEAAEGRAFTMTVFEKDWEKLLDIFMENPLFGKEARLDYCLY